MQWKLHVRFGGRPGETHRSKDGRALRSDPYLLRLRDTRRTVLAAAGRGLRRGEERLEDLRDRVRQAREHAVARAVTRRRRTVMIGGAGIALLVAVVAVRLDVPLTLWGPVVAALLAVAGVAAVTATKHIERALARAEAATGMTASVLPGAPSPAPTPFRGGPTMPPGAHDDVADLSFEAACERIERLPAALDATADPDEVRRLLTRYEALAGRCRSLLDRAGADAERVRARPWPP